MVMIADGSFNYCACLNVNYHALTFTTINYHQLSCSLDMLKFDMIIDDSFCHLNEWMIVFWSVVLPKKGLKQ